MNGFFDLYTIIFLVVAVAIFLRLRSVLGRRTGHERPTGEQMAHARKRAQDGQSDDNNVIHLPGNAEGAPAANEDAPPEPEPKTPLERTLADIRKIDPSFTAQGFEQGASSAYEMIVTAYAAGDRRTLRPLLSREVYEGFVSAIAERENRGEKVESSFVGIDKADITDAALSGKTATLTVTFSSQMVTATTDAEGKVLAGDPNEVSTVTDIWSFSRDVSSRDPNWKLVSTESPDGDDD